MTKPIVGVPSWRAYLASCAFYVNQVPRCGLVSITLACLATAFSLPAMAAPSAYILCKAVATNGDSASDGGSFTLSANASGVGNLGDYSASVTEGATNCDVAKPFPGAGTDLVVNETAQPSGWINAPLYPRWAITGAGLPVGGVTGNGATATLGGANFAAASGTVTVTVTNAKVRRVTVCKQVIDNATLPANQGGTFAIQYASPSIATTSLPLMAATEGQTVCTDGTAGRAQPVALNIGDTSFTVSETSNPNPLLNAMAPGYPRYTVTDANGSQNFGTNGTYSGTLNAALLASTSGDLTVTIQNKPDAPLQVLLCLRWEDDGVAPLQPATSFYTALGGNSTTGGPVITLFSSGIAAQQVSEGGVERCQIVTRNSTETYSTASNYVMRPNFGAFAAGYPKWEMYSAAACPSAVANSSADVGCAGGVLAAGRNDGLVANPLVASATGESVEIDWSVVPQGVIPKIVLVNKSGPFGNGALPNTGNVGRLCKEVASDGNSGTNYSGNFAISAILSGVAPRGYAMTLSGSNAAGSTGALAESSGIFCGTGGNGVGGSGTFALPNWVTNVVVQENVWAGATWPGNNGPVVLTIRPAAGGNTTSPISPTNMVRASTFYDYWQSPGLNLGTTLAAVDDIDLIVKNTPASPRRVQLCMKLIDNGINGNESNTWNFTSDGSMSPLALTEGGPEVCQTNFVYPVDDGVNPLSMLFTTSSATTIVGYALGYPRAEYSWNGGAVQAAPGSTISSLFASNGRFAITIPNSVLSQTTGDLKFTVVMQMSQQLRLCKQVLNNGDAINDGGTFTLIGISNGAGFDGPLNVSRNLSVTETTPSTGDGIGVSCAVANSGTGMPSVATWVAAAESQPSGWNNSPGFPLWKATNGSGTVIASGSGTTVPSNVVPRLGTQTPDGIIEQGNITITFTNRTGASRFMQICKELDANANPTVISAAFGLTVTTNDPSTPTLITASQTVTEGQPYTTVGNCSSQANVPDLATAVTGSETMPPNWALLGGNAAGYPQWYVVDATGNPVPGLSGSGLNTGAIDLSAITTPDFRIVFKNRADVAIPTVAKSFSASPIIINTSSTLTITLTNSSATTPAILLTDLVDNLPGNVVIASPASASTTCTLASGAGLASVTAVAGASTVTLLASGNGAAIPAGGSCTVTVNVTSSVVNNTPPCYTNTIAINALQTSLGNNVAAATANLCVNPLPPGTLTVSKTIVGAGFPAGYPVGQTFPISVDCGAGATVYNLANLGSQGAISVPAGATCTVSEGVLPAPNANYAYNAPSIAITGVAAVACTTTPPGATACQQFIVPTGSTLTAAVTNTLVAIVGGVTTVKQVTGPLAGYPAGQTFAITLDCGAPATANLINGGSSTNGAVPAGSTCRVSETTPPAPNAGYAYGTPTIAVVGAAPVACSSNPVGAVACSQFTVAAAAAIQATVTNPLQSGSLTINKTVSMALPSAATFNFTVSCTNPTAGVTPIAAANATPSIAIASGGTTGSVTVSPIAAGSTCSVTETAPAAIANYTWGTTPGPNAGIAIGNGTTATTGFTNTLTANPSTLTVTKTITGPAGFPAVTGSFPFTVACLTPTATYNGTINVTAGNTGNTTVSIPAGSTSCSVAETLASRAAAPAGYAWGAPSYTQPVATAMVPGGTSSASIGNPLQSGSLTINKTVSMALPTAATFTFTVSCSAPVTTPATIALGSAVTTSQSIAIASGGTTGSVTVSPIAAGSTCSVTESAPAAITNYAWGTTPAAVTGLVISNAATVNAAVTNTLTPLDPPFISKRSRMIDDTTVEWTISVVNNSLTNAAQGPVAFTVTDALPVGVSLIAGSVSCTPVGTPLQTTVATCGFNAGNTNLSVTGTLAYTTDATAATASQRVDIVFRGTVAQGQVVSNTACTNLTGQVPGRCDTNLITTPALPVPAMDAKALGLLMLLLAFMGLVTTRRSAGVGGFKSWTKH